MASLPAPFDDIDWALLGEQKLELVRVLDTVPPESAQLLEGLLNFVDTLQDHAVDVLGIPENEVFPTHTEKN